MNILTWLSRRRFPYEPLIHVEISASKIIHNLKQFQALAAKNAAGQGMVAPVLKSNAYGHGLFEVAHILKDEPHIPFFVVDSYFEAIALRSIGFKHPILVIGYTRAETMRDSSLRNVAFTVTSIEQLRELASYGESAWLSNEGKIGILNPFSRIRPHPVRIHIKIDTGMHRQGIMPEEVDEVLHILKKNEVSSRPFQVEGVCSHLSDADDDDEAATESQTHLWNKTVKKFKEACPALKYTHLAATDGHRLSSDIDANVSRLGIGLYGLSDNQKLTSRIDMHPALEMKTIVTGTKTLKAGETVGYGNSFTAPHEMTIATIPVGYFEGVDRRLSSGPNGETIGYIQVGKARTLCPIIGRVSMNITIIDVSAIEGVEIGEETIVISAETNDQNSIVSMAKKCGTIPYEIAVHISSQLKRVVV